MPEIRSVGKTYVSLLKYPMRAAPRHEAAWSVETEPPYRRGHGRALRIGRYWAVIVGRWGTGERDEVTALRDVVSGLDVPIEEIRDW